MVDAYPGAAESGRTADGVKRGDNGVVLGLGELPQRPFAAPSRIQPGAEPPRRGCRPGP
jgi:hypothetical protein